MLSKKTIKFITSLHHKKFRREEGLFIAEGEKIVGDLIDSDFSVRSVYLTGECYDAFKIRKFHSDTEISIVTEDELKKITALTTPQNVLAVAETRKGKEIDFDRGLKLVLDDVRDPGNAGTLLRIADWFGINEVIFSEDSVDCYNPKVVQSSMGSLFHVKIFYKDLKEVFENNLRKKKLPVYGTVLNGRNLYSENLSSEGFILAGNESSGIGAGHLKYITNAITIPSFKGNKADSLNVAVATGIICAEFRKGR